MRLSVCIPMFFRDLPMPEAIAEVARLGYDAAEFWKRGDIDLDATAAALKEHGVELMGMCTDCFALTDPAMKEEFLQKLEESCVAANKLGCKRLITQGGKDTGAPRADQHQSMVATLSAAVPILEKYEITLMLEPLNTLIDHKDAYLWSSLEGFEILREVGSERVKLLYDIYHQQIMEGNIINTVIENLPYIAHLHAAGSNGRNEPDNGELNYPAIFKAIEEAGYQGACALEYKPLLPPHESLKAAKELCRLSKKAPTAEK